MPVPNSTGSCRFKCTYCYNKCRIPNNDALFVRICARKQESNNIDPMAQGESTQLVHILLSRVCRQIAKWVMPQNTNENCICIMSLVRYCLYLFCQPFWSICRANFIFQYWQYKKTTTKLQSCRSALRCNIIIISSHIIIHHYHLYMQVCRYVDILHYMYCYH